MGSCINVTDLLPITSTVSKTKSIMYNSFFIHHVIKTKFQLLWYRVRHRIHRATLYWVQYDLGFPLHQSWLHLLCSFHFVIIWAAPSNLTSGITLMWLAHNDIRSSCLLSASVEIETGHMYSMLEVQKVQCLCSVYLHVDEPCSFYGHTYHPFKWSSDHPANRP